MTAFDLFQEATCHLGEGERHKAADCLQRAIDQIDRDQVDAFMRPDLVALRDRIRANVN